MDERAERWQRRFEPLVLVAALLVIALLAIEQSNRGEPWQTAAAVLNWSTWIVFALEAVVMIALARWVWIRSHPLDVAIVILMPPFLPASLQAARVLRPGARCSGCTTPGRITTTSSIRVSRCY